jgi:hypothetical protein
VKDKMNLTIPCWYLVKRNWPHAKSKRPFPLYAGLGGDVWPFGFNFDFDKATKNELQDLHARKERSETIVDFGFRPAGVNSVCTDAAIAEEYFAAVKKHCGEAWLLKVELPHIGSSQISGFDIGNPDGGFSVIETELITQGLPGPNLNEWGLIQTLPEALAYLEARKENGQLEQFEADEVAIVAMTVISKS